MPTTPYLMVHEFNIGDVLVWKDGGTGRRLTITGVFPAVYGDKVVPYYHYIDTARGSQHDRCALIEQRCKLYVLPTSYLALGHNNYFYVTGIPNVHHGRKAVYKVHGPIDNPQITVEWLKGNPE